MDGGLNAAFVKLKLICDELVNKPSEEKLLELKDKISTIPIHVLQTLHEFVLFPFFINLLNPEVRTNAKLNLSFLETLQCILEKIHLEKIKIFTHLHMALVQQIYDEKSPNYPVAVIDEDIKLSIVQCLELLFKNLSMDLRYDLYSREKSAQLSQCCYVCLKLAKNEKLRVLRIKAIECIMAMTYTYDEADFSDKELRFKIADVMMLMFPGITSNLLDISIGDTKQGHKITTLAIKSLYRIIVLHMQDDFNIEHKKMIFQYPPKPEEEDTREPENKKKTMEEMIDRMNNAARTEKWYKDTAKKLKVMVEMISSLQYHDHPKVRLTMAELCEEILLNCFINMTSSIGQSIEILIALSEDDDPDVSNKSKTALTEIMEKSFSSFNTTPIEIVEDKFYDTLTKLPRIMNEMDLSKKLNALNLLVGYLRILGPNNLYSILQSVSHLKRLVQSLIHISQMERSNISLFEEHTIRDFEVISQTPVTWKQFTYISENVLLSKFQIVLRLISESDAVEILLDHLCDLYLNNVENKNEAIFLLNELISVSVPNMENRLNIINRVFNMYLEEENWYLPLSVEKSEEDDDTVSLFNVHNNIIQTCLLVEGIGNMAKALEEKFRPLLFKALYIVLERAGSAQPLISAAGFSTLLNISKACRYESVTKLIVENTDYFSFHVIQRIKKVERNPNVLDVLNVVMNYSTIDVLPSILDIINGVLLQSCDKFQLQNSTAFLKVFLTFMQNLQRWMNLNTKPRNRHVELLMAYKKNMDTLYSMYTDYVPDFVKMKIGDLSEEDFKDTPEEDTDEYKKPEPPETIKLTVSILKRALNFLPNKDRQQKILVLDILKYGVNIISQWEDELLPIVHLIWSPFVDRFKEFDDPLIINRSFELLTVLATTSKDFIRRRTSKDVFFEICSALKKLAEQSYLKDRGSAYRYTQAYKLQINLLKNFAQLITDLEMSNKDVELAMEVVLPYLSNKQPIPLQELAVAFYKTLAFYDFDGVWLCLINVYGTKKYREEQICKPDNEKNVESILKILNLAKW